VLHCVGAECTFRSSHTACVQSEKRLDNSSMGYFCCVHVSMAPGWRRSLHHSLSARVVGTRALCCQALSYRRERHPGGLLSHTICLGQLSGVIVLQVAAEDLSGCGEVLVCKAQRYYSSANRNVIGIRD